VTKTVRVSDISRLDCTRRILAPALLDRVERDHAESDHEFRRRRIVVAPR
jgi:hypothetical protein